MKKCLPNSVQVTGTECGRHGLESFQPCEVLEYLLFMLIPQRNGFTSKASLF